MQTLGCYDINKDIHFGFFEIHRNIAEYNIKNESTLSLFIYEIFDWVEEEKQEILEFPKYYSIFIRTLSGMTLSLNVSSSNEIRTIKTIIEKKIGIPLCKQYLFFKLDLLNEKRTLADYNIKKDAILHLVERPNNNPSKFFFQDENECLKINNDDDEDEKDITIFINTYEGKTLFLHIYEFDTIKKLKKIIQKIKGILPEQQKLFFLNKELEDNRNIKDYNIMNYSILDLYDPKGINNELKGETNYLCQEKNLYEKQDNQNIIINKDYKEYFYKTLLKRNQLNVNLLYFDLNMTNKENYIYFNNFKVDVVGGFHAIDDLNILKEYLGKLKEKDIPFIVISTGTSGKDVISICKEYPFVKEVIIFCRNYDYNKHYIKEYPGYVKKILTSIKQIYEYIGTFEADKYKGGIEKYLHEDKYIFSSEEIKMNKQLQQCPLISSIEYDRCFYLVHKAYSHFFGEMFNENELPMFNNENLNKILDYLNQFDFEKEEQKNLLIKCFKNLSNLKTNDEFVEKSIRAYTGESQFCYLFNRIMRNFETGLLTFAYYMGPFLYGLNKYVKENNNFAILKDKKLYRIIKCSKLEFYQYKLNLGHIVCFPSLTSTSSKEIKFKPSKLSQKTNNINEETMTIKMIFKYKYKKGDISPGIIIEDKKIKDGSYLSKNPKEKEVLLFPFTFAKINDINSEMKNGIKINIIRFEIINRNSYIEYTLKNDCENRLLLSKL